MIRQASGLPGEGMTYESVSAPAQVSKPVRVKVVSGYRTGWPWSNSFRVKGSCGHSIVAQGFKGAMPKTTRCYRCEKEAVKPQAQDSTNEKPESVPAPTSRRQLRLLCVLGQARGAQGVQPVATLQPMPPRPRIHGQWPPACRAPLVLRDTQARCPTAQVLARCVRHRQANAFRPASRTI